MMENEKLEVEQMKSELASLKYILSERLRVEDRSIRNAMALQTDHINRKATFIIVLSLLTMVTAPGIFSGLNGLSVAFSVATDVMLGISAGCTFAMHWPMWRINWATDNLVTVAETVQNFRRQYVLWPRIGLPMVCLWLLWLLWELYGVGDDTFWIMASGASVGAIIGGVCGLSMNRHIVRSADDILRQIDQLKR
ncbi:MAG: hypothetical protein K2H62_00295 [Bacteroidales bacterium]|nr:hypothetical protein [Bacteroidales bacterium]